MKDLGNVSVTCENVKETTASKRRVLKAWWTQLEHVVNVMDEDAGIASCRQLFHNKVPLVWRSENIFLSACEKMLGAMYNMACLYVPEANRFSVDETSGLAYMNPIMNACTANDLDRLDILLDGGYDVNTANGNGPNALHWVALNGCRLDFFHRILENITDVNAQDKDGDTALMLAAVGNHLDLVKALLKHPNIDLNVQDFDKDTALHFAVIENHPAIVEELLKSDNLDCTLTNDEGMTPLQLAIDNNHLECEQLLRAHGAPVHGSYQEAFEANDVETEPSVNALLDVNRDPNEVNILGRNVLYLATWRGCTLPLFDRILEKIEDVNRKSECVDANHDSATCDVCGGNTPLMIAALNNRPEIVNVLMNHPDIDVNLRNHDGMTALHIAAEYGHPVVLARLLSDERVDCRLVDCIDGDVHGWTPLRYAVKNKHHECEQLLRAHVST